MLFCNRNDLFTIPHTSKCIINTMGVLKSGDVISVTSPVFTSTMFKSGAINTSDRFDVKLVLLDSKSYDNTMGGAIGTLVCDDNNPFNMRVEL